MNQRPENDKKPRNGRATMLQWIGWTTNEKHVDDVLHREHRALELALILVVLSITVVLHVIPARWITMLNLYFLPVSLGGFYLGRYRAGVMSAFCVLSAVVVAVLDSTSNPEQSLLLNLVSVAVWGSVLGLTSMLIGTLSDERARRYKEVCASHRTDTLCDPLTGIANRRAFEQTLARYLADWQLQQRPFALALLDIDHFKKLNDTFGHRAGDKVLHDVARSLETTIRDTDLVARYGGEEFAIMIPQASVEIAQELAERARVEVEVSRYFYERLKLRVTISIGATMVSPGDNAATIVQRADEALFTSKEAGRNCAHFHDGHACSHFGAPLTRHHDIDRANHQPARDPVPIDPYGDIVTGLPSRKVLIEELNRRVAEARRYASCMSLMLIQLDNHADILTIGHGLEARVMAILGELTRGLMRDADLVVRYAPDQLAVMMPCTSLVNARMPSDRLRHQVAECDSIKHNGTPLALGVTIGLTELVSTDDAGAVLDRAILALSAGRCRGGNCCMEIPHDADQPSPILLELSATRSSIAVNASV